METHGEYVPETTLGTATLHKQQQNCTARHNISGGDPPLFGIPAGASWRPAAGGEKLGDDFEEGFSFDFLSRHSPSQPPPLVCPRNLINKKITHNSAQGSRHRRLTATCLRWKQCRSSACSWEVSQCIVITSLWSGRRGATARQITCLQRKLPEYSVR